VSSSVLLVLRIEADGDLWSMSREQDHRDGRSQGSQMKSTRDPGDRTSPVYLFAEDRLWFFDSWTLRTLWNIECMMPQKTMGRWDSWNEGRGGKKTISKSDSAEAVRRRNAQTLLKIMSVALLGIWQKARPSQDMSNTTLSIWQYGRGADWRSCCVDKVWRREM